jgi:hypothetical protein
MKRRPGYRLAPLLICALAGCGKAPVVVDTGSRDVVRGYFEALCNKQWDTAYSFLHPDVQKRYSSQRFSQLAQAHRQGLGLVPLTVQLRSCEEHSTEAVARVTLTGAKTGHRRRYNDGVLLRQSGGAWKVILPESVGRRRP